MFKLLNHIYFKISSCIFID